MMSDPIGDMLTHIRNAQMVDKVAVSFPASRLKLAILKVLKDEGYVGDYAVSDDGRRVNLAIKYHLGKPVIEHIRRYSKPGLRRYAPARNIPLVKNGLGISVVSTSQGIMSDHAAREANLGGEILCEVS